MKVIFFDLDDTLYDRGIPFERAFEEFFGINDSVLARTAYQRCSIRGNEVFDDSQTGKITMEEMYIYRYRKGLGDVGFSITPEEALAYQRLYAQKQSKLELTPKMVSILNVCQERFDKIGILTNGPGAHQREKIACLELKRWLTDGLIMTSGECGVTKPNPLIFEMTQERAEAQPNEMTYVGDSYSHDLHPAISMGWKTVWLNRKNTPVPEGCPAPTYIVSDENALLECVKQL